MKNFFGTGVFMLFLVGCKVNSSELQSPRQEESPHTHITSASAGTKSASVANEARPSSDVIEFVKANYGEGNSTDGTYTQNGVHYTICAYHQGKNPGAYHYLVLCSTDDISGEGQVDLYVLTADANDIVASNTGISTKAADIHLIPLDKNRFGFLISQSEINQGIITGESTLYISRNTGISAAVKFIDKLDNTSGADCRIQKNDCVRILRKINFGEHLRENSDIIVVEHNGLNEKQKDIFYKLTFDPVSGDYAVPSRLNENF